MQPALQAENPPYFEQSPTPTDQSRSIGTTHIDHLLSLSATNSSTAISSTALNSQSIFDLVSGDTSFNSDQPEKDMETAIKKERVDRKNRKGRERSMRTRKRNIEKRKKVERDCRQYEEENKRIASEILEKLNGENWKETLSHIEAFFDEVGESSESCEGEYEHVQKIRKIVRGLLSDRIEFHNRCTEEGYNEQFSEVSDASDSGLLPIDL